MEHKIDATNKVLGRLATEVALVLRGKRNPSFERNVAPALKVTITNVSKMRLSPKKLSEKEYIRYSGYPGGQKKETARMVISKKGHREILRRAVYGMLPKNKNRDKIIKNLVII